MNYFLFTLICCLSLTSCQKEIPFDIDDDGKKIVLNSFIGPNMESVVVYLSQSQSVISSTPIQVISNATVQLFKNGTNLGNMVSDGDGKFTLEHTPEAGATYRVEASAEGLDPVHAETRIPNEPVIASVSTAELFEQEFSFELVLSDNGNQENYYQLLMVILDDVGGNPSIISFSTNSPLLANQGNPFGGEEDGKEYFYTGAFFTDDAFSGESISLDLSAFYTSSTTAIQYLSCTEEYYLYKLTLENFYENNDNPFAQPVQIYSNIEGGLGIFAGYSFDQVNIFN